MPLKINENHLLEGEGVDRIQTPKNSQPFQNDNLDTIIIHYTAGRDAKSSADYLADSNVKASAHLVIGRQGELYHLVPFNKIAWHAGISSYGNRVGYNNYSIGIELDNAGVLNKAGNEYVAWFGKKYMENEVMFLTHRNESTPRYWHIYTEAQIEKCREVCSLIIEKYKIKEILGHEEISVGRKQDPGPAFPLDKFRDRLLFNNRNIDTISQQQLPERGKVSTDNLNIREGASVSFDKVALPLKKGTEVKILEEKNGWFRVQTNIEGWVTKGFIET